MLPTHTETFGITIAEALSHSVPVITTKGTPWQGLEARNCGWWIDAEPDSLAEALDDAMTNSAATLAAMGQTISTLMHEIKNILQLAHFSFDYIQMGIRDKKEKYLNRGMMGIEKSLKDMYGFIYEMLSLTNDYNIQPETIKL